MHFLLCEYFHTTATGSLSLSVTPHNSKAYQASRAELNCTICPILVPVFRWTFIQKGAHGTQDLVLNTESDSEYSLIARNRSQIVIINTAQWRHAGVYECIASINGEVLKAEASLDVLSELHYTVY